VKPFVFKLETLLAIRKRREEESKIFLAQARARLRAAKEYLEELKERLRASWAEFTEKRKKNGLLAMEWQMWHKYLDFVEKEIKNQENIVEQLAQEVASALRAAEKAMKDRKSVEKLRERRFDQYKVELQAAEQKVLDEIAITRYQR
jgi:flagellar FliJ protein